MKFACENLTISYNKHPILHHITCDIKLNTTTAIIGPNGAGKSTFLKAMLGQIKIDSGNLILDGIDKSDIAYLPQINTINNNLSLTVEDVVSLGVWYEIGAFKKVNKLHKERLNLALDQVGLSNFNNFYINELSMGQLQRVLLAKIILQDAKIIVLDEPFSAIDVETTRDILNLIDLWQISGKTIVSVLHEMNQIVHFKYTLLLSRELIRYDLTSNIVNSDELQLAYNKQHNWQQNLQNNLDICDRN